MQGLKQLMTVQAILTIAIVGAGTYYLLKKRKENSQTAGGKSLGAATEADSDLVAQATAECHENTKTMRFSESARAAYMENCINEKLKS